MSTTTTTTTTKTAPVEPEVKNLNLASLKSVLLVQSLPRFQSTQKFVEVRVESAKQYRVLAFIFAVVQFQLVWTYAILHSIPWPNWVLDGLYYADEKAEGGMQVVIDKLDWWEDVVTIKAMRAFETVLDAFKAVFVWTDNALMFVTEKWEKRKEYAWVMEYINDGWDWVYATAQTVWRVAKETLDKLDGVWREKQTKAE